MDILTERGQKTLSDERQVAKWVDSVGYKYVHSPKNRPAKVDAILMKEGEIIGVAETKCRYGCDSETFKRQFNGEWLVTWEKISAGISIATGLGVPFYGLLYLPDSKEIVSIQIADHTGTLKKKIRLETTSTQRSVNGGNAVRTNAFITIDKEFTKVKERT